MTAVLTTVMRAMYAPKSTHAEQEWEDAAAYSEHRGIVAVADGASSSYRAGRWSAALVESFVAEPPDLTAGDDAFAAWVTEIGERFQSQSADVSETSWYASDASRRGSFATFCGLKLHAGATPGFVAAHVGDACLFHVRDDRVVTAALDDPASFGSTPDLLSSSRYDDSNGADRVRFLRAPISAGDVVFLTTDALGAAMLRLDRAGQPVWRFFAQVGQHGFDRTVDALRASEVMDDDDVTMLRVRVTEAAA